MQSMLENVKLAYFTAFQILYSIPKKIQLHKTILSPVLCNFFFFFSKDYLNCWSVKIMIVSDDLTSNFFSNKIAETISGKFKVKTLLKNTLF